MSYYILKVVVSAAMVIAVSEAAKRSSFMGGLIASLPIVSLLALSWLYVDTRDPQKVAALSWSIFWLVLPSLTLFAALAVLLRLRWSFGQSLGTSLAIMAASYLATIGILKAAGLRL